MDAVTVWLCQLSTCRLTTESASNENEWLSIRKQWNAWVLRRQVYVSGNTSGHCFVGHKCCCCCGVFMPLLRTLCSPYTLLSFSLRVHCVDMPPIACVYFMQRLLLLECAAVFRMRRIIILEGTLTEANRTEQFSSFTLNNANANHFWEMSFLLFFWYPYVSCPVVSVCFSAMDFCSFDCCRKWVINQLLCRQLAKKAPHNVIKQSVSQSTSQPAMLKVVGTFTYLCVMLVLLVFGILRFVVVAVVWVMVGLGVCVLAIWLSLFLLIWVVSCLLWFY